MKLIIAAVVLTFFVFVKGQLTIEQLKKLKVHREQCMEQTGVDPTILSNARQGSIVDDPKLKEHLFCMFQKIGFMNEAGEIQKDVLKKKIVDVIKEEPLADTLIEQCAIKLSTPESTAFESYKCFRTKTGLPIV